MINKMKINKKNILLGIKKRLIIWTIALIVFYIFSYLIDPFSYNEYVTQSWGYVVEDFLWVLGFSILISEVSIFIDGILNKLLPWSNRTVKRLLIQALLQIAGSLMIVVVLNFIFTNTSENLTTTDYHKQYTLLGQWIATNIFISLIISTVNTVDYLLENWKKTAMEAAEHELKASEHKQAAMTAELQALKLQIDPHFIFNNLSVLSELILEDQQLGYEYSESFAKVYRYLLINSKKDAITLEEELKFLNAYIYLTEKRIGKGVVFDISIHHEFKKMMIPPMTLQFLVENALKHNQTSKSNPLKIKIYTISTKYLVVHNTLSPLINKSESSGLGIKNIINRFEFVGDRKPLIIKTDKDFIAKIPLYEA